MKVGKELNIEVMSSCPDKQFSYLHTSANPVVVTSIDKKARVRSSLRKTSHLLKSIQYLSQNNVMGHVNFKNTIMLKEYKCEKCSLTSSETEASGGALPPLSQSGELGLEQSYLN